MIRAENLSRRINGVDLLHDVTLEIADGDRIGLVGKSGGGKSTLLRAIAMLDPLDQGRVMHDGELVEGGNVPSFRRRVAYLSQHSTMVAGTVEDNLRLPFQIQTSTIEFEPKIAARMLEQLGRLPTLLQQDAFNLSGGERQTVSVIRLILANPQVLLLDEPTASLDPMTTSSLESFLQNWIQQDSSRAWIWTSHDAAQIDRMCTNVIRIENGTLTGE